MVDSARGDRSTVDPDLGDMRDFATRFVIPFTGRGEGHYRIERRGLAADGHAMRDPFAFQVE